MRNHILSVIALAAIVGCKGSHESTISGAVQKGPFVLGSAINVALVDDAGAPTGLVFPTTTSDDLGAFEVTVPETGLVSLHADGFWFNEVTGDLSTASIALDAFADSSTDAPTYVNMVTHLSHARAARLLETGSSFEDAVAQAEGEMRTALSIGTDGFDPGAPGTEMNALGGDNNANAYGLAVSAVLVQAAIDEAGADGPIDATLQQLVNTFASDLADDGLVAPTLTTQIDGAQANVDVAGVEGNLAQRVTDVGGDEVVADLDRSIDSDLDGHANATDNCPALANTDQVDADTDAIGDACQCGNNVKSENEECDDGNDVDGDGCENDCTLPRCGNGIADVGEFCLEVVATSPIPGVGPNESRLRQIDGIGDLDGDGFNDLVLGEDGRYEAVVLNDGTGGFGAPVLLSSIDGTMIYGVLIVDAEGDGDLDIVAGVDAGGAGPNGLQVFLNDGSVGFSRGAFLAHNVSILMFAGTETPDGTEILALDPNGSAVLDVLAPDGTGAYSIVGTTDAGQGWIQSQPEDLDGDGGTDVLLSRFPSDSHVWEVWSRSGTSFVQTDTYTRSPPDTSCATGWNDLGFAEYTGRVAADVNTDGVPDVLAASECYQDTPAVTSFAMVSRDDHTPLGAAATGQFLIASGLLPVTLDGHLGVFTISPTENGILRLDGTALVASGTQSRSVVEPADTSFDWITFGDVTGDGIPEQLLLGRNPQNDTSLIVAGLSE